MPATLTQIAQYLDHRGWKYHRDDANDRIVTGVQADHVDQFVIVIQLQESGEYLSLAAPQLLMVKDHVYKGVLFQTLLAIAWDVKLLRWEYDPSDGEIRASIGFALEDADLTERQFNRVLTALIQLVDTTAMPRIQQVLATGTDPGARGIEEQLASALQEMLPAGGLEALRQALGRIQGADDQGAGA